MPQDRATRITIRPCREADKARILALIEPYVEQRKILPRTVEDLERLLANAFVAVANRQILGFVALEVYSRKLAEIRSLVVAAEHQGRGIGKRLVQACVERAQEKRIFEVMAITSSEGFFRSCGFDFTLPGEKKAFFIQTREQH